MKHSYEVTIHMVTGNPVTVNVVNEELDKREFTNRICHPNFTIFGDGGTAVNMSLATYIEVKETYCG